jgi:ABC-type Fe3+ transport system permease subunit
VVGCRFGLPVVTIPFAASTFTLALLWVKLLDPTLGTPVKSATAD